MKKFVLTFIILICLKPLFSQSSQRTSYVEYGAWNKYFKEWNWKKVEDNFDIKIEKTKIYINDQARTVISVYGPSEEKSGYNDDGDYYVSTSWSAYDEKSNKCLFMMMGFREKNLIIYCVIYNDLAFRYYCPQNN